jgi:4-hydroxy-tetrahydrodipicolinate reductase
MGLTVARLVLQDPDIEIATPLERKGHPDTGKSYGDLVGAPSLSVPVADSLAGTPDVLIDFTSPEGMLAGLRECADRGIPFVTGTTGLKEKELAGLDKAAAAIPIVAASNMSLGMNLAFQLVEEVARQLGPDYDVEIVETHHHNKQDAPSGSALTLAEGVARGRGVNLDKVGVFGRRGMIGQRPKGEVAVHALRGGDIVGEHTVSFISEGETVEIVHRARSRDIFARGALHAARRVQGRKPGLYTFRDLL